MTGFDVVLPQSPAPRHSEELTQQASSIPSSTQQRTSLRLSQKTTQPMEWTPTPITGNGATDKTLTRHSQETTQPAITELYTQYRERLNADDLTMITDSMVQHQQAGEVQTTHITNAAQLTHPISCADDVDMTPAPVPTRSDTHGIATATAARRSIGGRCRKWAVSTQDPSQSNKRKCAACTTCGHQFTPGEPRLQQWADRNAQRAYVHAQCRRTSGRPRAYRQNCRRHRSGGYRHLSKRQYTQCGRSR